ncbi:MAG: DNA recombination protein RmuC [Planctomycetota bacterium]|nr:DNA recombination protein RmuC [Planctomycetota bacterium]
MLFIWLFLGLLAGLAIGAVAMGLVGGREFRQQIADLQTTTALADQRQGDLAQQLSAEKIQTQTLRDSLSASQRDLASACAQFDGARQNLLEQRKLLDEAQSQMRNAFASASSEALARNNEAFLLLAREKFATLSAEANGSLDQRKEQIDALLKPMRAVMDQYQLRVVEIEKSRVESYSMLREQLGCLAETQRTLNTQTSQLVTALSRPTVRGQWGEISLRRLVELAGLSSRCDFVEQETVQTEQGRLRPDMIVKLPGSRDVIIDCKTCLDAFLDAAAATDETIRRGHLQRHAQQLRSRARELGAKNYWSQFSQSPEYVVMFLPGEAFLYAAIEHDSALIEDCLKNRVIVATPTTLIGLLKTIEFGWRQEEMTQNTERIRSLGVELYDRIGTLMANVSKLGKGLAGAVESYNSAVGSLETRVLVTARKMGELGARTDKEITEAPAIDSVPRQISHDLFAAEST